MSRWGRTTGCTHLSRSFAGPPRASGRVDVDGLYTWFLRWPHGDTERAFLSEMGDPDLIEEKDRTYFVLRRSGEPDNPAYGAALPITIPEADPDQRYEIPFYVADDIAESDRVSSAVLSIKLMNLIMGDKLTLTLNGQSIADEPVTRDFAHNTPHIAPRGTGPAVPPAGLSCRARAGTRSKYRWTNGPISWLAGSRSIMSNCGSRIAPTRR